jgi:hypothetical protein
MDFLLASVGAGTEFEPDKINAVNQTTSLPDDVAAPLRPGGLPEIAGLLKMEKMKRMQCSKVAVSFSRPRREKRAADVPS